ncbi:chain-length determining protein [Geobacter pelophilus]|uniref:Chain-length determining protein n=1 Tax=Geoanaerobacter pelophilus TaxID=60036 RepID=A0AAW4L5Y0_9BACT|nr:Wzz/FepE/Etk N-terminal domain-containing protein [Geoanaerobacter pelophilus]MBT0666194.1 chain-length determining protein [Geoanaerobacter pelophilus]
MQEVTSINDLLAIVRRRKFSIVLPALTIFVVATLTAFLLPPTYRSTSTILIEDQEVPREYVTSTVTGFAEQRLHTINQRIMSTPKLLEIINRFNLYADLKQKKTTEEIVAKMRKDIKFETISADVIDPRTGRPTPATIAFTLSYQGKNPGVVQQIANVLASLYLEENLKVREQQTLGTSTFMGEELKTVQSQLAATDAQISAYKQRNLDSLPELAQVNIQGLDMVERDINQFNDQLRTLRERESNLQTQLTGLPAEETSSDRARLGELKAKLNALRTRVSDEYPDVVKLKVEIAGMERQIRSSGGDPNGTRNENPNYVNISAQLNGVRAEIEGVKRQLELQQERKRDFRRRIAASPRVEEGFKAMLTERNSLQLKYDDLNRKYMESKVAHGLEKEQKGERFSLIDAARLPELPVSPNIPAILIIGLILGIGVGVGVAALREFSDHSVRDVDLLAKLAGVPVLAAIPEIVTDLDRARVRSLRLKALLGTSVTICTGIMVFHFLVMDLNVFWAKLLRRMML